MWWQNAYQEAHSTWCSPWDAKGTGDFVQILHSQARKIGLMIPDGSMTLRLWVLGSTELSSSMRRRRPGEEGMSPPPFDGVISGEL